MPYSSSIKRFLVAATVVVAACDNSITDMASRDEHKPATFAVRVDPSYAAQLTPEQAKADELQAIEALVERVPAEQRANVRRILTMPSVTPMRAADPEAARLLCVIGSIRAARSAPAAQNLAGDGAARLAQRRATPGFVVQVALAPELPISNARAVVIRHPGDNGMPLLLLSESGATADDLNRGLRVAIEERDRLGVHVQSKVSTPVRETPSSVSGPIEDSEQFSRLLAHLRTVPQRSVPGVGAVRSVGLKVPYQAR